MIAVMMLAACSNLPTTNQAPRMVSVNGIEYHIDPLGGGYGINGSIGAPEPGTDFAIDLDFADPEGRHVRVWWPASPAGFDFDPDATSGVWHVPEDPGAVTSEWEVVLVDTNPRDPASSVWYVPIELSWIDTGEGYEVPVE
jgi:hypothetical protein